MVQEIHEFHGVKLPELSREWAWVADERNSLGICKADELETDSVWYWVWYYPKEAPHEEYEKAVWKHHPDDLERLVLDNVESVEQAIEIMRATLLFNME